MKRIVLFCGFLSTLCYGQRKADLKVKTRAWGQKYAPVADIFEVVSTDRKELNDMRQKHINRFEHMQQEEVPNYFGLTEAISDDTVEFINKVFEETIQKLGPPPTPFSIFTMGSLARKESGFFTDLEIGFLVQEKTPEVKKYFDKFAQIISDRFFLLGEHPDVGGKGLRIDEADNAPAHLKWYARYASGGQARDLLHKALRERKYDKIPFEGSRIFLATPEEFAQHSAAQYIENLQQRTRRDRQRIFQQELAKARFALKNKGKLPHQIKREVGQYVNDALKPLTTREQRISESVASLSRNIMHLFGDENTFDQYIMERERILQEAPKVAHPHYNNRRQEIAFSKMREDIAKHLLDPKSPITTGKLGKVVDLKRQLYRFPEQILTNLGFYYNLGEQNTFKIIKLLVEKGIMSQDVADQLADLLNYVTGLRLKQQKHMRKQGYAIDVTKEEFEEHKKELLEELDLLSRTRTFLKETLASQKELNEVDERITKLEMELKNLEKIKPLEEQSILTQEEVDTLNSKYLPILKALFDSSQEFIKGDKNAFHRLVTSPVTTVIVDERQYINRDMSKMGVKQFRRLARRIRRGSDTLTPNEIEQLKEMAKVDKKAKNLLKVFDNSLKRFKARHQKLLEQKRKRIPPPLPPREDIDEVPPPLPPRKDIEEARAPRPEEEVAPEEEETLQKLIAKRLGEKFKTIKELEQEEEQIPEEFWEEDKQQYQMSKEKPKKIEPKMVAPGSEAFGMLRGFEERYVKPRIEVKE